MSEQKKAEGQEKGGIELNVSDAPMSAVSDYVTSGPAIRPLQVVAESSYVPSVLMSKADGVSVNVLVKTRTVVMNDPRYAVRESLAASVEDYPAVEYDQTALLYWPHDGTASEPEVLGVWEKRFEGEERSDSAALDRWGEEVSGHMHRVAEKHRDEVAGRLSCGCGQDGCPAKAPTSH